MVFRIRPFALMALLTFAPAALAVAQEQDDSAEPLPSLSERLDQFRQDLLGEPGSAAKRMEEDREAYRQDAQAVTPRRSSSAGGNANTTAAGRSTVSNSPVNRSATDKMNPSPAQGATRRPTQTPPQVAMPQAQQIMTAQAQSTPAAPQPKLATPRPTTAGPARLETQSARRAQGSKGLIATKTPPDRDTLMAEKPAPPSRVDIPEDLEIGEVDQPSSRQTQPEAQAQVSTPAQTPTPARSRLKEPVAATPADEPRVARALPRPVAPRELEETADEPAPEKTKSGGAVLFTTQSPVLAVEATGPRKVLIGREARFAVKIRNSGSTANNVVVTVNIPENVDVTATEPTAGSAPAPGAGQHGPLEWKLSRLEGKSVETLQLVLVPRKSVPLDLAVNWTFTPEASQTMVEVQEPKLAMAISGPTEVQYGQSKIFKLTVSNPGNGDTENVVISLLPIGRTSDGVVSHKLGTLHAGESKAIDVELTARQSGKIAIKAQAYADGGLRTEAAEEVLVRRANLDVAVEAPKVKYAGTVGTYRDTVKNTGNWVADSVQVTALLPPDAKYVGSTSGGRFDAQQGKVTWSAGAVQPAAERTFDLQCTLSTPGDNRLQFVASADDNLSSTAASNTQIEALADLKLEVRDPQGPIGLGEDTVYEVVVRNRGTKSADNVDLAVFFSEGLEAASVEGGAHEIGEGQVLFKPITAIGPGETIIFRVHAKAAVGGNHVFRAELVCQDLNTKLAAEEATLFYGDDTAASAASEAPTSPQPRLAKRPVEEAPAEETPAEEAPAEEPVVEEMQPAEAQAEDDAPPEPLEEPAE